MHYYVNTSSATTRSLQQRQAADSRVGGAETDEEVDGGVLTLTVPVDDKAVDRALVRLPLQP